ncbi:hypothetical protein Tco_1341821 [Tanacetum coccineum]
MYKLYGEDASKQGRIDAIDTDEEITLVIVQNVDKEMFDVNVLDGREVFVAEHEVAANKENDEVNVVEEVVEVITDAAQVSAADNIVSTIGDATTVSAATTTTAIIIIDKGKGILIEPVKPMKKKDLIRLDEEATLKLQAEFDEEERLAREKAKKEKEANIALIETWDDIQAKIDADHQLAERLQEREQEELTIEEKATLFQQLLEKRRKHFAAKRAEEKRNKPPTKGAFKRVNTFKDFRTELVEGKEKRARTELIQEITKKQKVEDDKETAEHKQLMKIIPDEEEVAIDAIPLAVNQMLKSFNREDLEDLYKLVKTKYESTKTVEDLDLLLWGDLKTMFEPHIEDVVWRNQQAYKVLDWKLYDSCGAHSLRMQHMQIYMLIEKKYPLALLTLSMMLEKKLNIDYESEMAFQLLKFIIKQLKK